ncbi:MAG: T9SS type A sorting domain-containing protein, partial [Bacteroidia bacterium]
LLCNAIVTDDGGVFGKYGNDSATYLLFEDPTASQYKVSFLNFKTENGYDYLYLIDGDSLSAPYFYYTGSFATPPAQFVTTQNKLLILFEPDNAVNDSGFILKVECISPLPIELLSWNVEAKNCTNYLNWTIGSTKDFSHFDIEMSEDGKLYTKLGSIKFNPNEMNYSFADYLTNETQKLRYYRLKMVDINDAFTYSKVISILPKCNGKVAWTLSPNPAHSHINIKYGEELYRVNILNANGALVRVVNIENASYAAINIEDLASGTYLIEAVNSKGVKQYKIFVKQ